MTDKATDPTAWGANRRIKTAPKCTRVNKTALPLRAPRAPSSSATRRRWNDPPKAEAIRYLDAELHSGPAMICRAKRPHE